MRTLLIVHSYHHHNTGKIAKAMAGILEADIREPQEVEVDELEDFELIGFGSGIYGAKHDASLLDLADDLPPVDDRKAFLFSTSAIMGKDKVAKDHESLRRKLQEKGYRIVDEFACKGFNTNSFLKYIGGMNRGRPNDDDLRDAEEFARDLLEI